MIACVVPATAKRQQLIEEHVIPSIAAEGLYPTIIGDLGPAWAADYGWKDARSGIYRHWPPMTGTTLDALLKRDIGTWLANELVGRHWATVFLADDHALLPGFGARLKQRVAEKPQYGSPDQAWHVLIPSRYADHPEQGRIEIPNGQAEGYCAGHCGVWRDWVTWDRPFSTYPRHPNWDLLGSIEEQQRGIKFVHDPELKVLDLEPEHEPWK